MRRKSGAQLTILAFLLFYLSGCDTQSTDNSVFLTHTFTTDSNLEAIRYTFSSDTVQNGVSVELSCDCTLDIKPFLDSRSYSQSEILSATVTSARVKTFFPIGERLDYLNSAELVLTASGASSALIARNTSFPASQEVAMNVVPGVSVTAHMKAISSRPMLTIESGSLTPGTVYELGIEFTVELEMEGL